MKIIQDYLAPTAKNRPGNIIDVKYIVIHNNGVDGTTDENLGKYIDSDECQWRYASWHYSVDFDSAHQHLPVGPGITEEAYHAADGYYGPGNYHGVAIEICEYTSRQADCNRNAAEITADLLKRFKLPISAVKQHNAFFPKNCPRLLRATPDGWKDWLGMVTSYLGDGTIHGTIPTVALVNGFTLGGGFRSRYEALGALAMPTLGLPLGNEETVSLDGTQRVIQRFERGVLAWYPLGTPDGVEASNPFHVRCLTLEEVETL